MRTIVPPLSKRISPLRMPKDNTREVPGTKVISPPAATVISPPSPLKSKLAIEKLADAFRSPLMRMLPPASMAISLPPDKATELMLPTIALPVALRETLGAVAFSTSKSPATASRLRVPRSETSMPVLVTFPPDRVKFSLTERLPMLVMPPGFSPNCTPMGTLTVSRGTPAPVAVSKTLPSSNKTRSAVLARNEPPTSSRAFSPKSMPLGLIRNRFAVPLARINPSILEICPPVTRVMMLSIAGELSKRASVSVGREKASKL